MSDPRPPKLTTSAVLFLMTLVFVGGVSFWYVHWFQRQETMKTPEIQPRKVIYIKAGEIYQMKAILDTLNEPADVVLEPAVFEFQEGIFLKGKKEVMVKAMGGAVPTIKCMNGPVVILEDCVDFSFSNIAFESGPDPALKFVQCREICLHNLNFKTTGNAFVIKNSVSIEVKDCQSDGKFHIAACGQVSLINSRVVAENIEGPAVEVYDTTGMKLEKNYIKAPQGLYLVRVKEKRESAPTTVLENNIITSRHGLLMEGCARLAVDANYIKSETEPAVALTECEFIKIGDGEIRNRLKSTSHSALIVSGNSKNIEVINALLINGSSSNHPAVKAIKCDRVNFSSNQIGCQKQEGLKGNGGGIWIQEVLNMKVQENEIRDGYGNGIYIKDGSSEISILENTVKENRGNGIVVENSRATISKNAISQNYVGIILEQGGENTNVLGNEISDNRDIGIYIHNAKGSPKILENVIARNQSDGIKVEGSKIFLERNEIKENMGKAVRLDQANALEKNVGNIISGNKLD